MWHIYDMRTSFDLPDHLLALARQRAVAEGTSVRALVEQGLRRVLFDAPTRAHEPTAPYQVPRVQGRGGLAAGIEPTDSSQMLDAADADVAR